MTELADILADLRQLAVRLSAQIAALDAALYAQRKSPKRPRKEP